MKYRFEVNTITFFYLFTYILTSYSIFLFFQKSFDKGFLILLINFTLSLIANLLFKQKLKETTFNNFFSNITQLYNFGISIFLYGTIKFGNNILLFTLLNLFLISTILNLTRNWHYNLNNNIGWPIELNGLFFPLTYFFLKTFIKDMIFIFGLYFIIFILTISNIKFIKEKKINKTTPTNSNQENQTNKNEKEEEEIYINL